MSANVNCELKQSKGCEKSAGSAMLAEDLDAGSPNTRGKKLNARKPGSTSSLYKTPAKSTVKKNSQDFSCSFRSSSPFKSRLDFASVPSHSVDIKSCNNDMFRMRAEQKKCLLMEKKIMDEEWNKAKKKAREDTEKEINLHEEQRTIEQIEFRKMMENRERYKKDKERFDRYQEFVALKEAKRKIKDEEKAKELEYIRVEREKSIKRQMEVEEKKRKVEEERREKREVFLESVAAAKRMKEEEELRIKKETEFDNALEVHGNREILMQRSMIQKISLDRVEALLSN